MKAILFGAAAAKILPIRYNMRATMYVIGAEK
jgi:hypothetical protein